MKYRIKVELNRIPSSYKIISDFEKAGAYLIKHGVQVEFDFETCDVKGYTSVFSPYKNRWLLQGAEKLVLLDNTYDVTIFIFDQAEWATPPGSPYPLKENVPTGSCTIPQIPKAKPFISLGAFPADHEAGVTWVTIAHELMHSLVQNAMLQGIILQDVMDTYFHNDDPEYVGGNFYQQWAILKPWISSKTSQETLQATLTRIHDYGRETTGKLTVGQNWSCDTLELGWKQNQTNISSIPPGSYKCVWSFSPKFMKYTYEVTGVPGRSGIRIHSASFYSSLMGCIALGKGYANLDLDGVPDLINSRVTVADFEEHMGRKDFILKIV